MNRRETGLLLVCVAATLGSALEAHRLSVPARSQPFAAVQADTLVARVLAARWRAHAFSFDASLRTPFLPPHTAPVSEGAPSRPQAKRPSLQLNAVLLITGRPQVILEDTQGNTHIAGVGDTVLGQTVVRITQDKAVLRDRGGTYEVAVRE